LPGIRLNFGKGGFTSGTVGGRWFKTNVSSRGVKHTLSVPGTGVSYQTDASREGADNPDPRRRRPASPSGGPLLILVAVLLVLVLLAVVGVGILVFLMR
jgi:hypothetical protein